MKDKFIDAAEHIDGYLDEIKSTDRLNVDEVAAYLREKFDDRPAKIEVLETVQNYSNTYGISALHLIVDSMLDELKAVNK